MEELKNPTPTSEADAAALEALGVFDQEAAIEERKEAFALVEETDAADLENPNEAAPAAEEEGQTLTAYQYLINVLIEARQVAGAIARGEPSREMAIVVTKIDEAGLWLQTQDPSNRVEEPQPVDPSAADASDIWTPPGAGKLEVVGEPGTE